MTDTLTPAQTATTTTTAASRLPTRAGLALLALAVGGFAIGTTEFVTMGLLPEVAAGTGTDIPTAGHYVSAYALGVVVGAVQVLRCRGYHDVPAWDEAEARLFTVRFDGQVF